jgi:radical SAM superfamily enzyme with C-terminal helix-hairpin-helix motif
VFLILDAYIDEPAALGVPPYISQYPRYLWGALRSLGIDVAYTTIDRYRSGEVSLDAEYVAVIGGAMVPGRYMRGLPASMKELREIALHTEGISILGGPVARFSKEAEVMGYDHVAKLDVEAGVFDLLEKGRFTQRKRTYEEWLEWSVAGAGLVRHHPDFPHYVIAEIESFRGCPRYFTGGCSFCIEPMYGRPAFRPPENIIAEIKGMYELGLRNFRIGAQTDIFSYMAEGIGKYEAPEPNLDAMEGLFRGVWECCPGIRVLHLDNANPATIARHPELYPWASA